MFNIQFDIWKSFCYIVQKSSAYGYGSYGYGYYSYKALSLVQWVALLQYYQYFSSIFLLEAVYSLLNTQNNSVKYKQALLKITDFWESA